MREQVRTQAALGVFKPTGSESERQVAYTAFDPAINYLFFNSPNLPDRETFSDNLRKQGRTKFHSLDELVVFRNRLIEALGPFEKSQVQDIDIIRAAESLLAAKHSDLASVQEIRNKRDEILYRRWDPTKGVDWFGNGNLFASLGALKIAVESLHMQKRFSDFHLYYNPSLESVVHFFEVTSKY